MATALSALLALTACAPSSAAGGSVEVDATQGRDHWLDHQGPAIVRRAAPRDDRYLRLRLTVDETGRVTSVQSSGTALDHAAEAAVRRWRFRPFIIGGRARSVTFPATVPVYPPEAVPRRHVDFPSGDLAGVRIRLERTGCFGPCPAYSVEIRGDGSVIYKGEGFVTAMGERHANIAPEVVSQLVEQFRAADFFSLEDRYEDRITDQATQVLTLEIGERRKTVTDYVGLSVGMPTAVADLETAVDVAAGTRRWIEKKRVAESR